MNPNSSQNEVGGKDLLIKVGKQLTVATSDTSDTITCADHGLAVGDLVRFRNVDQLTTLLTTKFYIVIAVPASNTFKLSATRAGSAIVADETEAALVVDAYSSLGGLRTKTFNISSEGIDITNHDSDQWKKVLDAAGIRSASFSGSGVYTNGTVFQYTRGRMMDNLLTALLLIDVKNDRMFEANFKLTSLEIGGDFDGEGNYSMSGESSGEVTHYLAS